jgi:hypothetical protein
MRFAPVILIALTVPAAAQAAPDPDIRKIERVLRDPATADRISRSLDGLTDALMSIRVGPIQAALEGRDPTPGEQSLTVGDLERSKGPQAEAELRAKIRSAGPAVAQGLTAIANALPAMSKAMDDIERAVDRVSANMPDPTYPKR